MQNAVHQPSPTSTGNRLILESVGTADAGIVGVVNRLVAGSPSEVARLVYQAPSELVGGLESETADGIAGLLRDAGLRVRVAKADAVVERGRGEFEVALVVHDPAAIPFVVQEVAMMLGVDVATARRTVSATPAVLLGDVSEATVDALRHRFAALPVDVDVSRTAEATLYLVVASGSPSVLSSVAQTVHGHAPGSSVARGNDTLTVADLNHGSATELWELLRRTGAQCTMCNLDFERYDLLLESAAADTELHAVLDDLGVPERSVRRVLDNLPVVIAQNLSHEPAMSAIERVADAGGHASAIPYSTNRFALSLDRITNVDAVATALEVIGGLSLHDARVAAQDTDGAPLGSFTKTTALWLQQELRATGAQVGIVRR